MYRNSSGIPGVQKSSARWRSFSFLLSLISYLLSLISYLISLNSYLLSVICYLLSVILSYLVLRLCSCTKNYQWGCSLYVPVWRKFEVAVSLTWAIWRGYSWSPHLFWPQIALALLMGFTAPKQARAPAMPPSNRPCYGYSRLEFTSYRDI